MAGLAGAYLSLAYTPMWTENMTAGRGWIALALVVFATWRPGGQFGAVGEQFSHRSCSIFAAASLMVVDGLTSLASEFITSFTCMTVSLFLWDRKYLQSVPQSVRGYEAKTEPIA